MESPSARAIVEHDREALNFSHKGYKTADITDITIFVGSLFHLLRLVYDINKCLGIMLDMLFTDTVIYRSMLGGFSM